LLFGPTLVSYMWAHCLAVFVCVPSPIEVFFVV